MVARASRGAGYGEVQRWSYYAVVLTAFPIDPDPDTSPDRAVRKLLSVAVSLDPPSRLMRFWKLFSRFVSVLSEELVSDELEELDELVLELEELLVDAASSWIRLCRSLCRPPDPLVDVDELAEVELEELPPSSQPSLLPDAEPLCACKAAMRLCMKLPSNISTIEGGKMVPNVPAAQTMPLARRLS